MAFGPRKKGRRHRPAAKSRLKRRAPSPVASLRPWTPAAYREQAARAQFGGSSRSPGQESQRHGDTPVLESDWTLAAFALRAETRREEGALTPRPDSQWLPDAPILVSEWSLPAFAAREELRLAQEGSPPIEESDWTLVAYRERTEAIAAAGGAVTAAGTEEDAAPPIRVDFRPARFDRPTLETPSPGGRFWSRSLVYASGVAAVVTIGALFFRSAPPVTPAPTATNAPKSEALDPPPAPPRREPAATPATTAPQSAPLADTPNPPAPNTGAVGASPPAGAASPPALGAPQAQPQSVESGVPASDKAETRPPQPPATAATPARPAEGRSSAGAPKKTRVSEPHQRHTRDSAPARRGPAGWFDEVVNSVKRFGRALTP